MGVASRSKTERLVRKTQALRNINMTAEANHATAIIGPSGCGKSTFVRCLNRMHETVPEAHATGRVRIRDLDVYNEPQPSPSAPHRHGLSEAQSIPHHVDLRQCGGGSQAERLPGTQTPR